MTQGQDIRPWYRRLHRIWQQGPYALARRQIPEPGSENLVNLTWAVPRESPINYAIPNMRQFAFQEPLVITNHLVGLVGPGGYQVTYPYYATPLIETQTATPPAEIVLYG